MNKTNKKDAKTWFFSPYLVVLSLFVSFIFENFILPQFIFTKDYLPFILRLVLITLSAMLFIYSFVYSKVIQKTLNLDLKQHNYFLADHLNMLET